MADVDDAAIGFAIGIHMPCADEEARHGIDGLLRRGQADALQAVACQCFQPLQRQGEVAAALALHQRMDFIDDHAAHRSQHRSPGLRAQQHVQRFGRGDQDVRGLLAQRGALGLRGVAGAHGGADLDIG